MHAIENVFDLQPRIFRDSDLVKLSLDVPSQLNFFVVTEAGVWLDVAYQLLVEQFSVNLLDPHERYVNWLALNEAGQHNFPFLLVVAYLKQENTALIVGVLEGNIMPIADYMQNPISGPNVPLMHDGSHIFTIGHQVTAEALRNAGIKGVGTHLWQEGIACAKRWVQDRNGILRYAVLESEDASIGFWSKVGFRWPKGAPYWQPPLEFDDDGNFLYEPVEELLMLDPAEVENPLVSRDLILNIVATLYLNWSLDAYRNTLSSEAMQRAEDFVMGKLFNQVASATPMQPHFELVRVDSKEEVAF